MKGKLVLISLAGLGVSLLLGGGLFLVNRAAAQPASPTPLPVIDSRMLPDFSLPDIEGRTHSVSDLGGTPAVINFWATWCAPCEQEMPLLKSYAEQYPHINFVGINSGEGLSIIEPFIAKYDITFPVWLDQDETVTDLLKIIGLPTTYFIDSQGVIQAVHLGQLTPALLDQYLLRLEVEP